MVFTAFLFGLLIFSVSLFFVFDYVRSQKSMRHNGNARLRQRELQLKLQANLQARIEADERRFEATRRALLERAGGDADAAGKEHAA